MIKTAPVIKKLQNSSNFKSRTCLTGQHREMVDQMLTVFDLQPTYDLDVMQENQTLAQVTSRVLRGLDSVLDEEKPDYVLVQGDTTTALVGGLTAIYHKIPLGHIEAGLRTGTKMNPFPEEINRVLVDRMADLLFTPTSRSRDNLLEENLSPPQIEVTGNTVVDALLSITDRLQTGDLSPSLTCDIGADQPVILVTTHRRENLGAPLYRILEAIKLLAARNPDYKIVFPVHLNPKVTTAVKETLKEVGNVKLTNPVDYVTFVWLMDRSRFILTDSGGIQEEAPTLNTPVLVLRESTERPEAIDQGTAKLVGTETDRILDESQRLINSNDALQKMANTENPFGDGESARRILQRIERFL